MKGYKSKDYIQFLIKYVCNTKNNKKSSVKLDYFNDDPIFQTLENNANNLNDKRINMDLEWRNFLLKNNVESTELTIKFKSFSILKSYIKDQANYLEYKTLYYNFEN